MYEPFAYKHQIISKRDIIDGYTMYSFLLSLLLIAFFLIIYAYNFPLESFPLLMVFLMSSVVLLATGKRMYQEAINYLSLPLIVEAKQADSKQNDSLFYIFIIIGLIAGFLLYKPFCSLIKYLHLHEINNYLYLGKIFFYSYVLFAFCCIGWIVIGFFALKRVEVKETESLNELGKIS